MAELEVSLLDGEHYYDVDPCPFCGQDNGEFDENIQASYIDIFVYCRMVDSEYKILTAQVFFLYISSQHA